MNTFMKKSKEPANIQPENDDCKKSMDNENRNNLKKMLESPDFVRCKMRSIAVAKTYGTLTIIKTERSDEFEYEIRYCPESPTFPLFYEEHWVVYSADMVVDIIQDLPNSIYINSRDLLLPKELQKFKDISQYILYYWKCEKKCFVCAEDAYGHMTECGHTICIYCFQRSINDNQFKCGLCRHIVNLHIK